MAASQAQFGGSAVNAVQVGDFDNVDGSADPSAFVEWMKHQRRTAPSDGLGVLNLTEHDAVLDIGCGVGTDLKGAEAQTRFAIGIDRSETMVEAARSCAPAAAAARADAQRLPFADASFDAAWARAVLIHTPSPGIAVSEIARVLKLGGRVALSEPDHGSHVVSTSELEVFDRLKRHRRTRFRNPLIGRGLATLAANAGLTVVKQWVTPIVHTALATARAAGGPFDRAIEDAVADGAISASERDAYIASLEAADERDAFLFAGLSMSVVAVKDETFDTRRTLNTP